MSEQRILTTHVGSLVRPPASIERMRAYDAGIRVLSRLDHLVGERDIVERIGRLPYPGRWSLASRSAWNVARRCGWLHVQRLDGMAHNTPGGYMDTAAYGRDGEPNPLRTARAIAAIVTGAAR